MAIWNDQGRVCSWEYQNFDCSKKIRDKYKNVQHFMVHTRIRIEITLDKSRVDGKSKAEGDCELHVRDEVTKRGLCTTIYMRGSPIRCN